MNIQIFTERFCKIVNRIREIDLSIDDEISYIKLYTQLDNMVDELLLMSEDERIALFNKEAEGFFQNYEMYKLDLIDLESLNDIQIKRIVELNNIDFLFYQQINKIPYGVEIFNFDIMANMFQGSLVSGLNGPYHKLYLDELFNKRRLEKAIEVTSHQRPVVDKYGKSVSVKDKKIIAEKSIEETLDIVKKVLGEGPNEILARYPDYKYDFLSKIK